jgi:hypothetical protein
MDHQISHLWPEAFLYNIALVLCRVSGKPLMNWKSAFGYRKSMGMHKMERNTLDLLQHIENQGPGDDFAIFRTSIDDPSLDLRQKRNYWNALNAPSHS